MATIEMSTDLARMITSILSIGLGGTGSNTALTAFNNLAAGLGTATGDFNDTTYFITTNNSGATNDYYRRGYSILKANLKDYIFKEVTVTGNGNAVTTASLSSGTLTLTKGATFSLSSHNHDSTYVKKAGDTMSGSLMVDRTAYSDGGSYIRLTSNSKSVGIHVGSGGTNRGVYDWTANAWLCYYDNDNKGYFNGTATTALKCSSYNLTDIALTWSGSYSTGSWMLIYNGETGTNGGVLFKAINQANTATWVDGAHKWTRIDGDTMTGNLHVQKAGDTQITAMNTETSCRIYLDSDALSTNGNHGVYSNGYWDGSKFVSSGKWLIVRVKDGGVTVNGNCTGNAATATRINGNLSTLTDGNGHNIWVSSTSGGDGIPTLVGGVYIVPSTKTIVATTFSGNATTATTASKCSSYNLTDIALTWSSSYSTGDYMLIHNGETGANGGALFRAIALGNVRTAIGAAASSHSHDYLPLSGGTLSGNTTISKAGEAFFRALNTSNNIGVYLDSDSNGNHGIWSTAYGGSSSSTSSGKWMIYRDSAGTVTVNGNCTGSASSCTTASRLTDITTNDAASSSDVKRYVWISYANNTTGRPAYTSNLTYQTSTNTLFAPNITSTGTISANTFSGNATTATTASKCSSYNLTDMAFTWSSSYSTGSWMLIYNGETGANGGALFRAINQANTATWVDGAHKWTRLTGDTMTGNLTISRAGESYCRVYNSNTGVYLYLDSDATNHGLWSASYWNGSANASGGGWMIYRGTDSYVHTSFRLYGAVWNDYAETRQTICKEPGRVVKETGQQMTLVDKRLEAGCRVISDTHGICIGNENDTPIAVSGRVLVYPYQEKEKYELGAAVCSAPGGTVDIMTREEIMMYPERIIGTVSEIPDYDTWYANTPSETGGGTLPISVNGRIWVYVR